MSQTKQNQEIEIPNYLKLSKVVVWLTYIWVMFGVAFLAMRVFLLAFSANLSAGFASFVVEVSNDYLAPFRNIFTGRDVGETGYLDVSSLFAIIVYLFIAWGFKALIDYVQNKIDVSKAEQKQQLLQAQRNAKNNIKKVA